MKYHKYHKPGPVFSYKLRYIVGFGLVEMAISTNPKPTIYLTGIKIRHLAHRAGARFYLCWGCLIGARAIAQHDRGPISGED